MINAQNLERKHRLEIPAGKSVKLCRCWQSATWPYCDEVHKQINAETGDQLGPITVTAVAADPAAAPGAADAAGA